ncbi:MAG: pantetheine-phosphate adenylyltransferase [Candidatus Bathyarchaeota archaeon]|jgi:pantetheine-phosphate adenylyltransferase
MKQKFETVVVGGTFDELHKGHKALLLKAFEVGDHVIIGLCTDDLARRLRKNHEVAAYRERLEELNNFLKEQGFFRKAKIVPLRTPYGITLSKGCAEALVVSRETEARAGEINQKRKAKGLAPLNIIVIEMVQAENDIAISASRIRQKEIDREGHLLES